MFLLFIIIFIIQFISVQSLCHVRLFETPRAAACQASLSITNSQSLLKLMAIESVMTSNYPILYSPLLLQPSIFPSIRVFSNESGLWIRWPKYWIFIIIFLLYNYLIVICISIWWGIRSNHVLILIGLSFYYL